MNLTRKRVTVAASVALALILTPGAAPGEANADECGPGTVYDSELGACVPEVLVPPGTPAWEYPVPGFGGGGVCWTPYIPLCF